LTEASRVSLTKPKDDGDVSASFLPVNLPTTWGDYLLATFHRDRDRFWLNPHVGE
jgi:hypothetical protein